MRSFLSGRPLRRMASHKENIILLIVIAIALGALVGIGLDMTGQLFGDTQVTHEESMSPFTTGITCLNTQPRLHDSFAVSEDGTKYVFHEGYCPAEPIAPNAKVVIVTSHGLPVELSAPQAPLSH